MKIFPEDGFIVFADLKVPAGGGVQIEYRAGEYWFPCCIMPNRDENTCQELCNCQDWNFATEDFGFVAEYLIREDRVYWNWQITFDGLPENRKQQVRVRISGPGGTGRTTEYAEVTVDPGDAVFLRNWTEWTNVHPEPYTHMKNWRVSDPTDVPPGWYVASDEFGTPRLCAFGKQVKLPPVSCRPHLSGKYDLYLCFRECFLECVLHLPGGVEQQIVFIPDLMPATRFVKEIKVGTYCFSPDDELKITVRPGLEFNPKCRFGDIVYLKLLPDRPPEKKYDFVPAKGETVCYTEPYSMCYEHYLQNGEQADRLASFYRSMGTDTILAQTGRTGGKAMHYSSLCGWISDAVSGDDRQTSNGVSEALRKMEVLRVWGDACRRHGMRYLVCVGLDSPYPDSTLESRWAKEHPEYYHPYHRLFLDFSRPEVMDYASEQFRELAEYDIDGLSVGCTRDPRGVTGEQLVALFREIVRKIGPERRKELELNVIIVNNLPDHYEALEQLLKEDLIDSVYVGNIYCTSPLVELTPYRKLVDRYPGKRLLGLIDAWEEGIGELRKRLSTATAEKLAREYYGKGADGLYFYQGEMILVNPMLKRFLQRLSR